MKRKAVLRALFCAVFLCGGLSSRLVQASETLGGEAAWHLHRPESAWLQAYDPTLLSPRLLTQWEREDRSNGDSTGKVYVNLREAFLISPNLAFGVQAELPLNWVTKGGEDFSGAGDMEVRAGFVGRANAKVRWGLGMNARFDTASEPALGDSLFELRPIGALRWDATRNLNLGLNAEWTFSPDPKEGKEVENLQLKLPITFKLNSRLSGFVSYQPKWDLTEGGNRRDLVDVSTTVLLGKGKHVALTAGMEFPLSADVLDWKPFVGVQWFFR